MKFIHALQLIDLAIEHHILNTNSDASSVLVYVRTEHDEGWVQIDSHSLAQQLMEDKKGQENIKEALDKKGISFKPIEYNF